MPGKRREWVKKIARWLFETPARDEIKSESESQKAIAEDNSELVPQQSSSEEKENRKSLTPLGKACAIFLEAWEKENLPKDLFVQQEQLEETLRSLDKTFQEELIEWLYLICKEPSALKDLALIIQRGRVTKTDNIQAIRAFSYLSVFVNPEQAELGVDSFQASAPEEEKPIEPPRIQIDESVDETFDLLTKTETDEKVLVEESIIDNESFWEVIKQIVNQLNKGEIEFESAFEKFLSYSEALDLNDHGRLLASLFKNILLDINILLSSKDITDKRLIIDCFEYIKPILFKKLVSFDDIHSAKDWVNKLNYSLTPLSGNQWIFLLLFCSGRTLSSIGTDYELSRERVRQIIKRLSNLIGFTSVEIRDQLAQDIKNNQDSFIKSKINLWLDKYGRLPVQADEDEIKESDIKIWNEVISKNLIERIELYEKFSISIPEKEFDYHYEFICTSNQFVGNRYWQNFEHLKEFISRHAISLGSPDLMPKQASLPRRVAGVVTRLGGQSKVAKKLGLIYQGQLVGDSGGRRYWTDQKLEELLNDTNKFHRQDIDLMPNYGQILEFFEAQTESTYRDKKPNSAIAALTKMGNLHWMEVAKRFDKKFQTGVSQKAVSIGLIKAFVRDLGDHLGVLSPSELYVLFQAQGISRKEQEKFSRTFDVLIDAIQSGMVDKQDLEDWSNNLEVPSIKELLDLGGEVKQERTKEEKESLLLERRSKALREDFGEAESLQIDDITKDDLPSLDPIKSLKALDKAANVIENCGTDVDHIEFLKAKATAKLWDACFADEASLIHQLNSGQLDKDTYSQEVRDSFLEEFNGAKEIQIPSDYQFRDLRGRRRDPKLMQRLVAYRLLRDKRLLNLSGTGTGKTLSAIFAAQVCSCKRIFITCPNGVISSWQRTFSSAFPNAVVHERPEQWILPELDERTHVVIVNHERFQDRFADNLLRFCIDYQSDLIVIDEIHQAKKRKSDTSSQRRKLLNEFIRITSNINPNVHVLGLSATPVINNLYEGRSLIELITQEQINDVTEDVDLNSCMNLYQHFIVNGIRMNPGQLPRTKTVLKDIDATPLLPEIILATRKGKYHEVEKLLVKPKIDSLNECLERNKKTVIFITLIQNTLVPICDFLQRNRFSYSVYTGGEKEAKEAGFNDSLDEFINGNTEVLVASIQCAGTGVDGLQSVCNRAIFFQLPWTSTEYEQAVGRLDRDGTEFESVDVFLPITNIHLPNGEQWSWCQSKLDRIRSKKDIAKAAVDGEMPDAASMITPQEASKYWLKWLKRLEEKSQSS